MAITQDQFMLSQRMPVVRATATRPPTTTIPPRPPTQADTLASISKPPGMASVPTNAGSYGGDSWTQALSKIQSGGDSIQTVAPTPFAQSPGILGGYAGVNGSAVRNDPAVEAANAEFERLVSPELVNQYTLSGLGRSSALPTALSLGKASMLTPLMQDALSREQHRLDRGYGATEEELARRERSGVRRYEATLQQAQGLQGLGQNVYDQRQGAVTTGIQAGGVERGVAQNQQTSAYNDFLRRMGLSETATMGPFGQLLPGAFGSRTVGK